MRTRAMAMAAVAVFGIAAVRLAAGGLPERHPPGPPPGTDMVATFTENFDGTALDRRTWNQDYGPRTSGGGGLGRRSLWSNGEAEVYLDRDFLKLGIDPFRVADGMLTIDARTLPPAAREKLYGELARHPEMLQGLKETPRLDYSSGAITTRDVFQQRYGYFEVRAKWSAGKGVWPAFWLLPADGSWPPELDVIEAHGDKPGTTFQTFHPRDAAAEGIASQTDGPQQDFHVYGALWTPSHIDFYVDGRLTKSVPSSKEMNRPMYLLANLAIGGYWPGYPDKTADFAATMTIDYIRAWQFRTCVDPRKPCAVP